MEDKIVQQIKDGDFEKARKEILGLESKIRLEASTFSRKILLEQVRGLKEVYNSYNIVPISELPLKEEFLFSERTNEVCGVQGKIYKKNVREGTIKLDNCVEAEIEECSNTVFEYFECQRSVLLKNLDNCRISCSAQQIRINDCIDIELEVYTSTGVFLQNSRGIVIRKYDDDVDNKFMKVCDFSDPFGSSNFKVL